VLVPRGLQLAGTTEDALIGCIGAIGYSRTHARCRLGYWIAHTHWNHGYATEAAARAIEFAFADGIHRVEADHLSRNPASGRVMQKVGMRHEGTQRAFYRRFDQWEDCELYARLSDDG
jgi:RimJ/RimL family protein N-acetyltransferase